MSATFLDDGGPALARNDGAGKGVQPGMTLRDYFAGQAIHGLCADPTNHKLYDDEDDAARSAYGIANAMLRARTE